MQPYARVDPNAALGGVDVDAAHDDEERHAHRQGALPVLPARFFAAKVGNGNPAVPHRLRMGGRTGSIER